MLSNPDHELILFCFAKEVKKKYPDITVCSGCYFNDLSQSHHVGCNTAQLKADMRSSDFNIQKVDVLLNLYQMNRTLNLDMPSDVDIDIVMHKCNTQWKHLVADAIVYGFQCFAESWLSCI